MDQGFREFDCLVRTATLARMRAAVALAHRIYVMHDHRITGRLENSHDYTAVGRAVMRLVHESAA